MVETVGGSEQTWSASGF